MEAILLGCIGFCASTASAQVSDSLLECMCRQKSKEISSQDRLLGMCIGHYNGDVCRQRCGADASCYADIVSIGWGGVVDASSCVVR